MDVSLIRCQMLKLHGCVVMEKHLCVLSKFASWFSVIIYHNPLSAIYDVETPYCTYVQKRKHNVRQTQKWKGMSKPEGKTRTWKRYLSFWTFQAIKGWNCVMQLLLTFSHSTEVYSKYGRIPSQMYVRKRKHPKMR